MEIIIKRNLIFLCITLIVFSISNCQVHNEVPSLKDAFDNYFIGTAVNTNQLMGNDPGSVEIIKKHFNCVTPENMLKWERVHPEEGIYNFETADSLIEFAERNSLIVIGHTLIWHSQTPDWVFEDQNGLPASRELLLKRMKEHISTVVGRYKSKIHGWDVVNEAFDDNGDWRNTKWYQIIGEEYIDLAFKWACEADPETELYYNDYNMWHKGKRNRVVDLVKEFKFSEIKIDGIGLQGHWGLDYPPMDELESSFEAYSKLDVRVMVTELDMAVLPLVNENTAAEISLNYELKKELNPFPDEFPDSMHVKQSKKYTEFFNLFNRYKDVLSRVTFWGVHDGLSWKNDWPVPGRKTYPLLFDRSYQPKPAFFAVIKTVENQEK